VEKTSKPHALVGAAMLAIVALATVAAIRNTPPPDAEEAAPASDDTHEVQTTPPRPFGATPDDPPRLTHSGRVQASRNPDRPPALGPDTAKVTIVLFSDFTCSVCQRTAPATRQIVEEWPGQVRLEFRSFAPPQHGQSENAAAAGLAAHRQGKFWELYDLFFSAPLVESESDIRAHGEQVGLDMKRFERDYADAALRRRIAADTAEALRFGATGSPTFLVNGKLSIGWGSWTGFRSQIEDELKAVDALIAQGVSPADVHLRRAREAIRDDALFEAYRKSVIEPLAAG
jgi:protein-disulfide isomerase